MEWSLAVLPALIAIVVLIVPGFMVAVAAGQKGFDAFGVSPALSVTTVALSAIVAPLMGIGWSLWVPFVFALLLSVLIYGLLRGIRFLGLSDVPRGSNHEERIALEPQLWWTRGQLLAYFSVVLGIILLGRNITNAIGNVNWISQTYDVNFHLNAIRYVADTANGSSLTLTSMTAAPAEVSFYPAAWHDIASLAFMLSGADVPVVANAMSLVVGAVVWPIAIVYLARQLLAASHSTILASGVVGAGYVGFPLVLIDFGVLYPNSLGVALMPIGLALVIQLFRVAEVRRLETATAVVLGAVAALGVALAHPNALMSLLVMVVPVLIFRGTLSAVAIVKRRISLTPGLVQVAGVASILGLIWFLWGVVRPPKTAGGWEPEVSDSTAIGEVILNNAVGIGNLWVLSLLALVGAYAIVRSRRTLLWVIGTWAYTAYFYIAARSMSWEDGRDWVTGVWYHDAYRLVVIIPLASIPLVLIGFDFLSRYILTYVEKINWRQSAALIAVTPVILVGALGWSTQTVHRLENYVSFIFWRYAPDLKSPLLTPDEYNVLYAIDQYVPEDATIIANPWTGAGLAYAISGRNVTGYHTAHTPTPEEKVLTKELPDASIDPEFCRVAAEENAYYAIYFGEVEINQDITGIHAKEYETLEYLADPDVIEQGGVAEVIYRSGGATLYRITACG